MFILIPFFDRIGMQISARPRASNCHVTWLLRLWPTFAAAILRHHWCNDFSLDHQKDRESPNLYIMTAYFSRNKYEGWYIVTTAAGKVNVRYIYPDFSCPLHRHKSQCRGIAYIAYSLNFALGLRYTKEMSAFCSHHNDSKTLKRDNIYLFNFLYPERKLPRSWSYLVWTDYLVGYKEKRQAGKWRLPRSQSYPAAANSELCSTVGTNNPPS